MNPSIDVSRSLLVVDDDSGLRQMLCWAFEDLGYFTWGVQDLASAFDAVQSLSFAFALVDFHLPDGDGLSLLRRLRHQVPCLCPVLMSADPIAARGHLRHATESVNFFEKPVPIHEIDRLFLRHGVA